MAFDRSLQLDQAYTAARKNRAVALFNLRQPAKAEQELIRVSQEDPSDASTLALLGRLQGMTGRSEQAKQSLTRSLSLEPNQPQAWEDLARVERALNNTQAEVNALKRLVELEPTDLVAIHRLTRVLSTHPDSNIRDAENAKTYCELGIKIGAGEDPVMLQACASAYAAANLWEKAVDTAEQAVIRAQALGVLDVMDEIETEVKLYRTQTPLVLTPGK